MLVPLWLLDRMRQSLWWVCNAMQEYQVFGARRWCCMLHRLQCPCTYVSRCGCKRGSALTPRTSRQRSSRPC